MVLEGREWDFDGGDGGCCVLHVLEVEVRKESRGVVCFVVCPYSACWGYWEEDDSVVECGWRLHVWCASLCGVFDLD